MKSFSYFKRIFDELSYCFKLSYITTIHLSNSIFFAILCKFTTVNVINLRLSNSQIQIPRNKVSRTFVQYSLSIFSIFSVFSIFSIFSDELLNSCRYFPIFITRDYSVLVECIFRILITKIHSIYSNGEQYNSCKRLHCIHGIRKHSRNISQFSTNIFHICSNFLIIIFKCKEIAVFSK